MGDKKEAGLDLASALGAEPAPSKQTLVLYIPNRDDRGNEFDVTPWVNEAGELLCHIGGGVTILAPAQGGYLIEGNVQWEQTTMLYSYILETNFSDNLPALREFLHRFGRETRQREVAVDLSGDGHALFFRITDYDGVDK